MKPDLFKRRYYAYAVWKSGFITSPYTKETDFIDRARRWANDQMQNDHAEFAYCIICERRDGRNVELERVYYDETKEHTYTRASVDVASGKSSRGSK